MTHKNTQSPKSESFHRTIPLRELVAYYAHPFKLYEGERLADMVASVAESSR
jgi:hypothetical protein